MSRLTVFLALLGAAVLLAVAASYNHGYVLLVLPPWRVELSFNLLVILLLLGFIAGYALLRFLGELWRLPRTAQAFRQRLAYERTEGAIRDATRLLLEGRYSQAYRRAEEAFDAGHSKSLSALLALSAAHRLRDDERIAKWRVLAAQNERSTRAARLMLEAGMALDQREYEWANTLLEQAIKEHGRHIAGLRLLLRAKQGMGDWSGVLRLVAPLEKHNAMTSEQAAVIRSRAHRENLKKFSGNLFSLERYLKQVKADELENPELAYDAASALQSVGNHAEAARIIEDALSQQWDDKLVTLYGELQTGDFLRRISHAEGWLKTRPRDANLLLALGRLCHQRALWGKAHSYLDASISQGPTREAHLMLAHMLDRQGQIDLANGHYRAAAEL